MATRFSFTRLWAVLLCVGITLGGLSPMLVAQEGTAKLSGVVTDPSDAVVPGAKVTLESTLQHAVRETETNSAGLYVIPAILPGTYRLVVSVKGFQTHSVDNVILSSGQGSTLNLVLKVGQETQQVNVTEESPLLQSTTATLGNVVNSQQMTSLPLLGRNFQSLLLTLPGVAPIQNERLILSPNAVGINASIRGHRPRNNAYMLDGVPNVEILFGAVPMFPPPEAIAEMKVQSGMDSGTHGFAAGGSIDVVTKAGTKDYHGDVWEYLQNGALNARSFFQPSVGPYQLNQFGGSFGGPLVIPHILSKDKAWYVFGYYEGVRRHSNAPFLSFLPTDAQLNGDFTGAPPIYNPYTTTIGPNGLPIRQPFPGNIIPSGPTTLCAPQPTCINPAAQLIMRTLLPTANYPSNIIPGVNYVGQTVLRNTYDNWSARVDHQFGTKDTFFARYSDARNPRASVSFPNLPSVTENRFTNIVVGDIHTFGPSFVATARFGLQRTRQLNFTGGPDVATQAGTLDAYPAYYGRKGIPPLQIVGFPSMSQGQSFYGPEYFATWTVDTQKTTGRHTLGFGGAFYRASFITDNQSGTFENFTNQQTSNFAPGTGFSLASYLLGLPASAGRLFGSSLGDMRGYAGGVYAQDSWQITPKLHLNLGLRWDYTPPMINQVGSGTFEWETGQYYWDTKNPITGEPANIRRGTIIPDKNNFAPRAGIAYTISPKTVLRASYAIFYDNFSMNWAHTQQGNRGSWPYAFPQSEGSLNATLPNAFLQNPFPGPAAGSTTPLPCQCLNTAFNTTRTPYTQEWSLSLQRQLTPSTKLDLAYFGSHSINLISFIADNTAMTPGLGPIQARQRWPQFPPYGLNHYNAFPAYYDGLEVSLTKQYSQNLHFLASYTWSKTIDYMDELTNTLNGFLTATRFNIPDFRGPAGFDVRHRFVASYIYDIPVRPRNKVLNAIVGGWQHSGIVSTDTGFPYNVILSTDNANVGTAFGFSTGFPNLLRDPQANFKPTIGKWFDTDAFQLPPFGTYGNAGKYALYGQGQVNWNASFDKKWPFGDGRNVAFRTEFFNLLNAHTFANPGFQFGTPQFGRVNNTRQGGRVIQFALKIHF